ncbi:TnsD family Tn7-like transposition protein, partial [Streptococcus suis]
MLLRNLHEIYRPKLLQRGWLTSAGNLRTAPIATDFLAHCQSFRHVAEFTALAEDETDMVTQVGRLLRPPRSGTHPLRHLLLIHWLFG